MSDGDTDEGSDRDLREQIARLEAQIDALAETVESCRKIMLVAKVAIAGGVLLILAMVLGAVRSELAGLIDRLELRPVDDGLARQES